MTYDPSNIDNLTPSYLASYGLTEAPFSSQENDHFLYLNSGLSEQLDLLKHYTQYGNLLLLITGEHGIGKTSLKQRFVNTAQEEWEICEIQSHTMMDASLLLRQVATGFNITEPPLEPTVLFEVLHEQLEHMHQQSQVPILIIDDAHELPQDALQALFYLAEHHSEENTALRIILFCEPVIETMLKDPAIHSLKERVTHSMELAALDEAQTAEYLRHRLAVAGLDGTSPFTPKLINKIFKASEGIPAKINEYAHKNLLDDSEPFIRDEADLCVDDDYVKNISTFNSRNIILAGFAAAVVASALFFQDNINKLFEETDTAIIADATEIPIKPESIFSETTLDITSNHENPDTTSQIENEVIEFSLDEKNETNGVIEERTEEKPNTSPSALRSLQLTSVNPNPVPASKQRQIISINDSGFHKRQKVKVSWTNKEKILSDTQVNVTSESYMNLILNTGTQADTWTVTVIDTLLNKQSNTLSFEVTSTDKTNITKKNKAPPHEKKSTKDTASKYSGLYGQAWVKQQNKNHFTLQLLGTYEKSTLPKYIKKYALQSDAVTFKSQRNNKNWFTLVYGQYPTKPAAQKAADQLPKGVDKPWIRSFASILSTLEKTNKVKQASSIIPPSNTITDNQEGWLWSQDPSHYTLQLAAGTDKSAIQSFIKRNNLRGKAVYFHRLRDGKDWYILVHGSYAGYSKAKEAISQLPSAVQKAKPWTRTFGAIHSELN